MQHGNGTEKSGEIQAMFAPLARRYDLMNFLMTAGRDSAWRREVIRRAKLPARGALLDIGAGTGDLARAALLQHPTIRVVAADFTIEMMLAGRDRPASAAIAWCAADALRLPFPDGVFDAVVSGFLLRNVSDLVGSLQEQCRLLKPGGRIVALDTAPPSGVLLPFARVYLHGVIPALGKLVAGQPQAYRYLSESTESFLQPEQLASRMVRAGFAQVAFTRRMFGAVAIYWGVKPE